MIASSTVLGRPVARNCVTARSAPNANRKVVCNANATAWDSWTDYMGRRSAVKQPAADELKLFSAIGTSISSSATGFKPKHANPSAPSTLKQVTATFPVVPMSADLHQKLEALALVGLRQAMGLADGAPVDVASSSFTTTDVNAGVLITGCIQQQGSDKIAKIAFVAAETERQASWSRLEGLLLHWACSSAPGDAWHMPPVGWKAVMPNKSADAGGAVQCAFEKKTLPGSQEKVYLLVIEVPISGILRSGGITFVLKASDAQNTKWLKDCSTQKDFFIDVQSLPFTKA